MMTPELFDPSSRSDGTLAPGSVFTEPQLVRPTATRPVIAQPKAPVQVATRPVIAQPKAPVQASSGWNWDPEVSWYGPGFYGHRTACGYVLTTTLVGVAHKTLPCGTLITFKNPSNGRTITAPVVDRGPYVAGRQWDLTGGLCVALAHCYTGPIYWRFA